MRPIIAIIVGVILTLAAAKVLVVTELSDFMKGNFTSLFIMIITIFICKAE